MTTLAPGTPITAIVELPIKGTVSRTWTDEHTGIEWVAITSFPPHAGGERVFRAERVRDVEVLGE